MNASEILSALNAGEDKDWEFKSAKGGLPGSLWDTYSAMANTDGGVIVMGVKERDDDFEIQGVANPTRMEKDFWTTINNRSKVNANLLGNQDVRCVEIDGNSVLVVQVPRANRRQRPIFVGQNPLAGTFRRFADGDYQCSREEVGRMLADQTDQPADLEILTGFGINDLDPRSLDQYRNRFASRSPAHPWLRFDDKGLLEKLGGWRTDRISGQEGLTVAGLLMFGADEAIRDPAGIPQYHVDYRERLSVDPRVRWTDRIWPDGTWVANLFQFFERVYPRLVADLKIPFQFAPLRHGSPTTTVQADMFQRHDDTTVHEAIRETFVNAMIHADFRGQGGIIIERYRDRLEFSNPGTLLLPVTQVFKGGVSECRNRTLQGMFALLGYGEKAGSGIDKIRQGWASQKWRWPLMQEQYRPDRVQMIMRMVSLLPEDSLIRLKKLFGFRIARLDAREVQALVTAEMEGSVSNQRLQQFCTDHTTDITRLLQGLVAKKMLIKGGYGRGASYRLASSRESDPTAPDITAESAGCYESKPNTGMSGSQRNATSSQRDATSSQRNATSSQRNATSSQRNATSSQRNATSSQRNAASSQRNAASSQRNAASSQRNAASSQRNVTSSQRNATVLDDADLLAMAAPAREKARLSPQKMKDLIRQLCERQYLTFVQIGSLLNRHPEGIRNRILSAMVRERSLVARFPDPTHPEQAYRTNPEWSE